MWFGRSPRFYNYFVRGGFLNRREGLLLHLYHANYVKL